jgi:hypothetical protein
MLAAPFVAKAEFLMPVRKVFTRDDLADQIYHLEPTHSPLLEYLARAEAAERRFTGILVTEKD